MSLVVGIDVSSFAVDIIAIPSEDGYWREGWTPRWTHCRLEGSDAFDRTRTVGQVVPGRAASFWDDVLAVGIEEPAGRNPGFSFRVQGAVLSQIPAHKLVEKWMPSQWRKAVGMPGNATKATVNAWVGERWGEALDFWTQDACDAYCIALATRQAIERQAAA